MLGHAIVEQGWRISSRLSSNAPALHPFLPRRFPATRARGSRDLRPRVTRPAPAGHTTCARGSLALCRRKTERCRKKFPTSQIAHTDFQQKKEDKTQQVRVLSSSQYKYTTFFAKIQIPLAFRNNLTTVKMRRFAAAILWRVLHYEGYTLKLELVSLGTKKGAQRVGYP